MASNRNFDGSRFLVKSKLVGVKGFLSPLAKRKQYKFKEWREYARGKIKECSPLDISILFESGKLKTGLKENQDYSLLPEDAYRLLNEWHGKRGEKVSPRDNRRKVIKVGKFTVRTLVEIYPVDIKILTYFDSSDHHENGGKYTFKHFTRYNDTGRMIILR